MLFGQVIRESGRLGLALYEVLRTLLSAAVSYSRNPELEHYDGFVICINETSVHVSRAKIPPSYMRDLFERRTVVEDLPFYRPEILDIYNQRDRREITRLLIGLFRYLAQSEQRQIPGNYQNGFLLDHKR